MEVREIVFDQFTEESEMFVEHQSNVSTTGGAMKAKVSVVRRLVSL